MAHDDGRLLVGCLFGFGAGIYTFLKGFRAYRKYRLIADTPKIRIRSAPMGLAQVRGDARAEETLLSPIDHVPCYLYKVVVEEWHRDSEGGGEWKHVATDAKSVNFYLQDDSGTVLVDPANAELDLPLGRKREVRSGNARGSSFPRQQPPGGAVGAGATDLELLQYVEQARLRHLGQIVSRGISMISHGDDAAHDSPRQSLLSLLADPTGPGGEGFRTQMMKAMLARQDPGGETRRLALEVWKHPQGTPEFESALVKCAQAYSRAMPSARIPSDPSAVLAQVSAHPQTLGMIAMLAGAAEPQTDPEAERARQAAAAFGRDQLAGSMRPTIPAASGHYRLTEYCLLPGHMYDITGTCAENPHPRDEYDHNIIVKGTNEPTFLISSRAETEVQSWLRRQSILMVLGGAALAVVCLAIFLGKLGLL